MTAATERPAPRVSVVMPVFDGAAYLAAAIDSLRAQDFPDWELLVIDDGSRDDSRAIAQAVDDARVRVLVNPANLGLPLSRNRGIDAARAPFIAFLDSDDLALPQRLGVQWRYLQRHAEVAGVGADVQPIAADGRVSGADWRCPGDAQDCRAQLLLHAYVNTSAFMARAEPLRALRFDPEQPLAEDYDLYVRMSARHALINLPQRLIQCRVHAASVTRRHREALAQALGRINRRQLAELGLAVDEASLALHRHVEWLHLPPRPGLLAELEQWLLMLLRHNAQRGLYAPQALARAVGQRWEAICDHALRQGECAAWRAFYASPLRRAAAPGPRAHLRLAARRLGLGLGRGPEGRR